MSATQDNITNNNLIVSQTKFKTPEEEINYLRSKLDETQIEFIEFQESSRELEVEFETQVKQLEKKNSECLHQISRLEAENDQLKTKYNTYVNDTQHKLNEFQHQITELTGLNNRLSSYIRELEQNNDDLERARRALAASLEDFEGQLNQQIERNVLLENEVSEKEQLECVVQRLKEEARDLRHELIANKNNNDAARRKQNNNIDDPMNPSSTPLTKDSSLNQAASSNEDKMKRILVDSATSPPPTPLHNSSLTPWSSHTPIEKTSPTVESKSQQTSPEQPSPTSLPSSMVISPSSRISALNIVSDLLRQLGVLESKLSLAKKVPN